MTKHALLTLVLAALAGCTQGPTPLDAPDLGGPDGKADGVAIDVRTWEGVSNAYPFVPDYEVEANYRADYCELWLNGLGRGNFANGGATVNWIEAYVSAPSGYGEVLAVGMYARVVGGNDVVVFGREIGTDYWQTGAMIPRGGDIESVAFFVDVEWPDGQIVRLWQSNDGINFSLGGAFDSPSDVVLNGGGSVRYADMSNPLFDQKRSCDW